MSAPASPATARVCVGQFAGAHGVRGCVRLKPFTAVPEDAIRYGTVATEDGARSFALELVGQAKGVLIVRIAGVADRDAAQALSGTRLYVDRARLPEPAAEEFYHADLIGMAVETPDGAPLGTIRAVDDYGAGDLLDLQLRDGRSVMVPFTQAVVPTLDVAARRCVVVLPEGALETPKREDDAA
jgi:16S rRNA processing protein RimM